MKFENLEADISFNIGTFSKTDLSNSSEKENPFVTEDEILNLFTKETLEAILKKWNIKKH